jgi:hypothetical protein
MFFAIHNKINKKEVIVYHDGGNAFKEGGNSVFDSLGFKKHITYPTDVHQYLSVNDNNYHGQSKIRHRALNRKKVSDVDWSLSLMRCMNEVPKRAIASWWERNFLKGYKDLRPEHALALMGFNNTTQEKDYVKIFRDFSANRKTNIRGGTCDYGVPPVELACSLDGIYYTK